MFVCHVYLMVSMSIEDIPFQTSGTVVSIFSNSCCEVVYEREYDRWTWNCIWELCYTCLQDGQTYRKWLTEGIWTAPNCCFTNPQDFSFPYSLWLNWTKFMADTLQVHSYTLSCEAPAVYTITILRGYQKLRSTG